MPAARHSISAEVAPLFVASWSGHRPSTFTQDEDFFLNFDGPPTYSSVGLNLQYGYRFGRHFELGGGAEYLRAAPNSEGAYNVFRVNVTSFAVWGAGRPYDIALGGRMGFSALGIGRYSDVPNAWVPQFTNLLVVRQRLWVTPTVGVQLSGSAGVHLGRIDRREAISVPVMAEVFTLHLGLTGRF